MNRTLTAVLLALASLACESSRTRPPRPPPSIQTNVVSVEDQLAELERMSLPGENHRALDDLRGEWNVSFVEIAPDGSESEVGHGNASIRSELGGRFLRWDTQLSFGSRTHLTTGFIGYDLRSREYQTMMINDVTTSMSVARGSGDLTRSGIKFTLELLDQNTGARTRMTSVLREIDAGHFVQDLMGTDAVGLERVVRRYHYRRVSPAPVALTK